MSKMTTQRVTREVVSLLRRVGDDVIVRVKGVDMGLLVETIANGMAMTFEGVKVRLADCRIRIATIDAIKHDAIEVPLSGCDTMTGWELRNFAHDVSVRLALATDTTAREVFRSQRDKLESMIRARMV